MAAELQDQLADVLITNVEPEASDGFRERLAYPGSCALLAHSGSGGFMLGFHEVGIAALTFTLFANVAAAQSVNQTSARDSLWNGTLIGLGAGVGTAAALDAVVCENGFGGCDFPWAAYLSGFGAGAGAGIDFLIGRRSGEPKTTLRLLPIVRRVRKGVLASLVLPQPGLLPPLLKGAGARLG